MTTQKKKKSKVVPIVLGVLLLIGAFFGIREYLYMSKHVDTDDAQLDADISPVVARVGGYVDSIYFEENQPVKDGQLLLKLDKRDYQLKVEQAQAAARGAEANIGVSQAQITATAANTATASSNIEKARIKVVQAAKDYERYANLVKDGSVTQQQFEQARTTKESADADLKAAQAQYHAAQEQVGTTRSQLAATNTGADQRKVDIDYAKLQLSYTDIFSPASGVVSKKNVQRGQLVQAGQTLFSVVNSNSLYVTANFKETQLKKLKSGEPVEVTVDAFPDQKVSGEIVNFSPATGAKFSLLPPDNATGNYVKVVQRVPVKIRLKAADDLMAKLRPGMSVKVSVLVNEK